MEYEVLSHFRIICAVFCLAWYGGIIGVAFNGFIEIMKKFHCKPNCLTYLTGNSVLESDLEGVLIIRPIKGIDPGLWDCLQLSFTQDYPLNKLEIFFCVESPHDSAIPMIRSLIATHPQFKAEILISEGYDSRSRTSTQHFGPNPKVNNLAKGFARAQYDILWVMDSNVYASQGVLRNSVVTLQRNLNNGRQLSDLDRKVKLVHHVPLAINVDDKQGLSLDTVGAHLDEMFLFTLHSKFYVLLNNVAVAPCVNGKSNMYRRSDLDMAVARIACNNESKFFGDPKLRQDAFEILQQGPGLSIKLFARYISEDNMIAIALWENLWGRPSLTGDVVAQPLCLVTEIVHKNTISDYVGRRARWLRARKYMVLTATLVEPTTELIMCGIYGTFAVSTLFLKQWFLLKYMVFHFVVWCACDYLQFTILARHCVPKHGQPEWLYLGRRHCMPREFISWLVVWLLREFLAFPIWIYAMCGHKIYWRGKPFRILKDLSAAEL